MAFYVRGRVRLERNDSGALIDLAHPDDRAELTSQAAAHGLNLARLAHQRRPPDHFFSRAV